MKAVVTRDLRLEGGALIRMRSSPLRAALELHAMRLSSISGPNEGESRAPVRYLRGNFVIGRSFLHDADLEQHRRAWLDHVTNVRVHGSTHERPRVRFDHERVRLQPLAPRRYTSLVLDDASAANAPFRRPRPVVEVEKRALAAYARLAGGVV